jgi:hypothetical protein
VGLKIFIPSKNRQNTISTHKLFSGEDTLVVVHNKEQYDAYAHLGVGIAISNTAPDAYGLTRQREWCMNLTEPGEWVLFADDNIHELWAIPLPYYYDEEITEITSAAKAGSSELASIVNKYRPKKERVMPPNQFLAFVVPECIMKAQEVGAHLVGFSVTDNPLFRAKKWGTTSYVSGKMFLLQNTGMPWDHTITMEDFRNSAWHLREYGRVVINRYIHPRAIHYQPGGMGTAEERIPYRQRDCVKLMKEFPGLFRYKKGDYPDLSMRIHGEKSIDRWRNGLYTSP